MIIIVVFDHVMCVIVAVMIMMIFAMIMPVFTMTVVLAYISVILVIFAMVLHGPVSGMPYLATFIMVIVVFNGIVSVFTAAMFGIRL